MMDELDLLKKDWQKKDNQLPILSYAEIYNMIWKKSSSIVKWIMIISVLELIVPNLLLLAFFHPKEFSFQDLGAMGNYYLVFNSIYYTVIAFFIFLFYKRYREISILDDSKNLMRKIIKTRKTVKHYVLFCLLMAVVFFLIFIVGLHLDENFLIDIVETYEGTKEIPIAELRTTLTWLIGLLAVIFTLFMGVVYFLLYGLLLRKLNHNYKELQKLEV